MFFLAYNIYYILLLLYYIIIYWVGPNPIIWSNPLLVGSTSAQNRGWANVGPIYNIFFLLDWSVPAQPCGLGRQWFGLVSSGEALYCSCRIVEKEEMQEKKKKKKKGEGWASSDFTVVLVAEWRWFQMATGRKMMVCSGDCCRKGNLFFFVLSFFFSIFHLFSLSPVLFFFLFLSLFFCPSSSSFPLYFFLFFLSFFFRFYFVFSFAPLFFLFFLFHCPFISLLTAWWGGIYKGERKRATLLLSSRVEWVGWLGAAIRQSPKAACRACPLCVFVWW